MPKCHFFLDKLFKNFNKIFLKISIKQSKSTIYLKQKKSNQDLCPNILRGNEKK
jgi:hypothetical protein